MPRFLRGEPSLISAECRNHNGFSEIRAGQRVLVSTATAGSEAADPDTNPAAAGPRSCTLLVALAGLSLARRTLSTAVAPVALAAAVALAAWPGGTLVALAALAALPG